MDTSGVSLLVASLDLSVVKLIRGAMAAADAQAGAPIGPFGTLVRADHFERRQVIHPEPRYEPRPVIHPTPRYLPRPVIHPTPRLANADCLPCDPTPQPHRPPTCPPPWMQPLPQPATPACPRVVKLVSRQPDIVHKGTLIDTFI